MNAFVLSGKLFDWALKLTIIGSIALITYSILATVVYLTLSSRVSSNTMMDRMSKFTGQNAVVTDKGVMLVVARLMGTVILVSFLLSGGGFLLVRMIYEFVLRFLEAI